MISSTNLRRIAMLLPLVAVLLLAAHLTMRADAQKDPKDPSACKVCSEEDGVCLLPKVNKGTVPVKPTEARIDTPALKVLLNAPIPLKLVDARGARVAAKIPGALSLTADEDQETVAKALPDKDALIVTYCASLTCPASHMLATRLAELGYKNVIEYPKGIKGWIDDGGEVEQLRKTGE